jgi:RNA polymerase sigma-70 factor (ECF subfamily)
MRMTTDDESLARRAGNGDREAFRLLLERHYESVYRIGFRLLGDFGDAEDLAQEVCVGLARKLKSYRGESRFTTWLYRVAVNAARDAIRRRASSRRLNQAYADVTALVQAGHDVRQEEVRWLYEALGALADDLRETAILVLSEELSHAEAGAALGVKESTVSWRMHEVRKRLKALAQAGEGVSS